LLTKSVEGHEIAISKQGEFILIEPTADASPLAPFREEEAALRSHFFLADPHSKLEQLLINILEISDSHIKIKELPIEVLKCEKLLNNVFRYELTVTLLQSSEELEFQYFATPLLDSSPVIESPLIIPMSEFIELFKCVPEESLNYIDHSATLVIIENMNSLTMKRRKLKRGNSREIPAI
jgi:hypothetical protein